MNGRQIHFILLLIVFGLGAGVRYIFFFIMGKKKPYDSLIMPKHQDKWNVLMSFIITGLIIYLVLTYLPTPKPHVPPYNYR